MRRRSAVASNQCRKFVCGALLLLWLHPVLSGVEEGLQAYEDEDYATAFRELRPLAARGPANVQGLLGVMHYFGLGTPQNDQISVTLFQRAASRSPVRFKPYSRFLSSAQLASSVNESATDTNEEAPFNGDVGSVYGRQIFLTFCSGCHGFSGFAFYPPAPSFSMGDRMHKSDTELINTLLKGRNGMPSWEGKLPRAALVAALAYIRYMSKAATGAVPPVSNPIPERYYLFWSPDE